MDNVRSCPHCQLTNVRNRFPVDLTLAWNRVRLDSFFESDFVELEIWMRWFSSDAGQVAKIDAPEGYANVRAHAMFHREYLQKQQRLAQQAQSATQQRRGASS